jgi:hypothetical protein
MDFTVHAFASLVALFIFVLLCFQLGLTPIQTQLTRRQKSLQYAESEDSHPKLAFGKHRCKPQWIIDWVIYTKAYGKHKGCRTIANEFNLAYASRGLSVSKSFVHKALREHAYAVADLRRKWRNKLPPLTCVTRCGRWT